MVVDRLAADGVTAFLDPQGGILEQVEIAYGGRTITPLHSAPWRGGTETFSSKVAPIEATLAGDFFCAPFGSSEGLPIHGWPANGHWQRAGLDESPNRLEVRYELDQRVQGARLAKIITLLPGHPMVYQRHVFKGGNGALPVAHHAMIHVPGGAELSFSTKAFGLTPNDAVEPDPRRGRSLLAYPQRFETLSDILLADGHRANASRYPFASGHEDITVQVEAPNKDFAWSAAVAPKDGFVFFGLKNPQELPETILWMSNGGRNYEPWLGRHTAVLGIEEAATGMHSSGAFSGTEPSPLGYPVGVMLEEGKQATIRYIFGAIPCPSGWTKVSSVHAEAGQLQLTDISGGSISLPFDDGFLAAH